MFDNCGGSFPTQIRHKEERNMHWQGYILFARGIFYWLKVEKSTNHFVAEFLIFVLVIRKRTGQVG